MKVVDIKSPRFLKEMKIKELNKLSEDIFLKQVGIYHLIWE